MTYGKAHRFTAEDGTQEIGFYGKFRIAANFNVRIITKDGDGPTFFAERPEIINIDKGAGYSVEFLDHEFSLEKGFDSWVEFVEIAL